jgi:hypothetical protein
MHKFNISIGLLNQRICVFTALLTSKDEWSFNIGYEAAKNRMKNLVYIKFKQHYLEILYLHQSTQHTHEIQKEFFWN